MTDPTPIPIAIIGMACRLPGGSDSPEKLWDMLSEGRSGWREVPADRWKKDAFYHPDPEAKEAINTKSLYFLDQDINAFDARFFNIHPHEAHCLDPQQRILMETTYEALENAGKTLEELKGSDTSVHVGAYATDFERMGYKDISRTPMAHMIGTGIAILSNRISYVLDLKGPSSTVDTGCSGSMVALHQACHGLRARESKMAIVAGTQLVLTPDQIIPMSTVGMTNPDGKCYVFDSRGAGYARGEGVVTLILKRFDDAVSDGDKIHAIIRNSGLNQDGKTAGLTLPNPIAQANLMRQVYSNAGLDPAETVYVEAHGTGTIAGDTAEISSIAQVFTDDERKDELYVGSIKSNIGHLEASSGVAGLLKAILILRHGMIPPNIDFVKPKPTLHLEERNIKIATEMVPLPTNHGSQCISVNSFGYGGTNAHVILESPAAYMSSVDDERIRTVFNVNNGVNITNGVNKLHANNNSSPEYQTNITNGSYRLNGTHDTNGSDNTNGSYNTNGGLETNGSHETNGNGVQNSQNATNGTHFTNGSNREPTQPLKSSMNGHSLGADMSDSRNDKDRSQLFVLSAHSEISLQNMVSNLRQWVSRHSDSSYFRNLAYTLSTKRTKMQYRFSTAASTHEELFSSLDQMPRITKSVTSFRSVFLFTGQGAQWYAMGRELTMHQPVYRDSMLRSDRILKDLGAPWSLIDELFKDKQASRVSDAEISQPSTTAIQIALVDLLKSFQIFPDTVLGHSSGEIGAAYAAEALDHKTALEVSYKRGFMSTACARVISSKGAMMAVSLGENDIRKYIDQTRTGLVNVACVNSPVSTTISGDESAIDELKVVLDEESIFNRKLKVDTAYHSHHMKKVASEYLASIKDIQSRSPNPAIRFYSSVNVAQKTGDFDAQYWVDKLVSPVRFGPALELLCRSEFVGIVPTPLVLLTEIGPHGALAGPVRQIMQGLGQPDFKSSYLSALTRGRNAIVSVLEMAGKLFEFGYPLALDSAIRESGEDTPAQLLDDLPPYPWDHSQSYIYESNLSKQHRFRAHPPHDLLGLRIPGTTSHEPAWRNFLGVDSLPWLSDHVVDGFAIYPAAGYLSMVIEAARQIAVDRKVQGDMSYVHLKDVVFSKSIMIPERRMDGLTSDVEVLLTMRPARHLSDHTWETFRIMALSTEDVWHEHCSGSVMIEWGYKEDEVEGFREEEMKISSQLKQFQDIRDACDTTITHDELYRNFTENGNVYGPTFNGIKRAQIGRLGGIADIDIPDVASVMPRKYQQPHLIHPATFDTVFQLGIPLYRRNVGNGPVMPTIIEAISINCNLRSEPGTQWIATTTMPETGTRFAIVDIMVFEENVEGADPVPMITIKGGHLRGIGEASLDEATLPFNRKMSYRMNWQPDIDFPPILNAAESADLKTEELAIKYIQLLAFKQPHMKILEIGVGGGEMKEQILKALDSSDGLLLDQYIYTNTDASFVGEEKLKSQQWANRVESRVLDITRDPVSQGFLESTFDLIIVSEAFQNESLGEGLVNSKKLLKLDGRLVIIDAAPSKLDIGQGYLEDHGFQDLNPILPLAGAVARSDVIVATKIKSHEVPITGFPFISFICESQKGGIKVFEEAIMAELTTQGFSCGLDGWSTSPVNTDPIYIVIDNASEPILATPSPEKFTHIMSLLTRAKSVLWISCQESRNDTLHPSKGMINGLARVARRENAGLKLVTVNVQEDVATSQSLITRICSVLARSFSTPISAIQSIEDEYTFSDGQVLIGRVHGDEKFNDYVEKAIYPQKTEVGLFQQPQRPLKLEVETPGLLSSLRFVTDDVPSTPLGAFDLELEARAYGINFKDVFIAMGQMVPGVTMTGECAGVVRKVGSGLVDRYRIGDRVCGIGAEPFCSHPRIHGDLSSRIPPWMSFAIGASIPIVFSTAYHCIVEVANLQRGQSILIHAASGGVGQAAIQLAQNIGAEIFCTVGSKAKRQLLIDQFNISPSSIFSSRLRTFKQGILRLTKGKGVDVVLNSLSGDSLHDSFSVLASLGTFVEIGKSDIYKKNEISMIPFDRNVTFAAVDLTVLAKLKKSEMHIRLTKIISMFEQGTLQPFSPVTTESISEIEEAFRLIQSRKHTGKVVLLCDEKTRVKQTVARPKRLNLDKNGTYIIAGGLGDLGRRIAKFMAAHGAGHVVTLSRRKLDNEDHLVFQNEMRSLGSELHVISCDITDETSVGLAAAKCAANLPPVKGIVHAGMVLRDHPLEIMSHEDYVTVVNPKVQGTQNLDLAFGASESLDFFIMLSSITAILGTAGQSNYAVGNSYQDAFAQSKAVSKCRYVAINLGAVDGSLAITSLPAVQQEKMRLGTVLMSFEEVFAVLSYAMSSHAVKDDLHQLILGFDRKSMENVHDEMALANPMFSHIPHLETKEENRESEGTDVGKMLQQAKNPEDFQAIVVRGICERFAMFTARALEDISPDVSIDNFGLDSLVAIELKNWLVRNFKTTLQTSEVLDALNITSLAKTIASRSKFISREVERSKDEESRNDQQALVPVESAVSGANCNYPCCRAFPTIRKMPLNDFETIFDDYLENSRMFFSPDEFHTIERDVEEFRQPGSMGRKFYQRLYEQAHDPNIENWQDKYFLQSMYLQRRMPLAPFNNFMAFHPLGQAHTQAERAALIASIAFKCKQDLEADRWEPMAYLGTANCTDLWQYIFNTARLPGIPLDRMAKFSGNQFLAVFHRGHIYKVRLLDGEHNVSVEALTDIFQSILDREDVEENWASILSADDRSSWTKSREALIALDPINKETIDMVEASDFLVCLDDTEPIDAEDRIRQMMMLNGFNRWVDKSIAFVVCKNGTSGTYVEHTMIDAMTLFTMQTAIVEGITTYKPSRHADQMNGHPKRVPVSPPESILKTTPELDERILHVRQRFADEIKKFGYRDIILSEFGKELLLERHLPIKGIYDLICLLANYYYYGYNAQSWEAASMSHYHKGRPDIVQVNTPKTAHFCTVADDDSIPVRTRFEIMLEAANARNQTIKDAFSGHCYQRTLRALELCREDGEELPALFKNPLYEQTVEPDQMFSNTDDLSPESCFIMQNPKKFWMTYYVTDNGLHFLVIIGKNEVFSWAKCLQRASSIIKKLIDAA